jgi:DNA-binding NarL/FixJ family response regulator
MTVYTPAQVQEILDRDREWVKHRARAHNLGTAHARIRLYTEADLDTFKALAEEEDNEPIRQQRIRELHGMGYSHAKIARALGVSTRTIGRLMQRLNDANQDANTPT